MKILLLHQHFYPEVAGAAVRLTQLAVGLARKGFEVSVLTGLPNYALRQKVPRSEVYQGVSIQRVRNTRFNKNSRWGRILNAVSFFLSVFLKLLTARREALLLIGTDPPFLPLLGRLVHQIKKQRYLVLVYDVYPELALQLGYYKKEGSLIRLWRRLDAFALRRSEKIIAIGDYMKEALLEKLALQNGRSQVIVIPNWEDGDWIRPLSKPKNWFCQEHRLNGKTVVLYSGNMGRAHELASIIDAAELIQNYTDIVFLLIGGGIQFEDLKRQASQKKLSNVLFLPYQPFETLPYSMASGDIAIISMRPGTEGFCVPSKLYSALASGSAILGLVPSKTEVAELIDREQCGIRVNPGKPEEIYDALVTLYQNRNLLEQYRLNARSCFEKYFTREQALQAYGAVFESLR